MHFQHSAKKKKNLQLFCVDGLIQGLKKDGSVVYIKRQTAKQTSEREDLLML